ncbi:MAG: helix-turn-helix domain-containing protein [Alphaproteobacteria bacterium]|nr:helix-turn-helix domain-containing protein [Alphaproteobacteria bacterium]
MILELGKVFAQARERTGLSLEQVAENAKVESGFLTLVENGRAPIAAEIFDHLCEKGLKVPSIVAMFRFLGPESVDDPDKKELFENFKKTTDQMLDEMFFGVNDTGAKPSAL